MGSEAAVDRMDGALDGWVFESFVPAADVALDEGVERLMPNTKPLLKR